MDRRCASRTSGKFGVAARSAGRSLGVAGRGASKNKSASLYKKCILELVAAMFRRHVDFSRNLEYLENLEFSAQSKHESERECREKKVEGNFCRSTLLYLLYNAVIEFWILDCRSTLLYLLYNAVIEFWILDEE